MVKKAFTLFNKNKKSLKLIAARQWIKYKQTYFQKYFRRNKKKNLKKS